MEKKVKVEFEVGVDDLISMKDIYHNMKYCLGFVIKDNDKEKWEMWNSNCMSVAFDEDLEEEPLHSIKDIIFINKEDYILELENDYDYEVGEVDNECVFDYKEDAIKEILSCWDNGIEEIKMTTKERLEDILERLEDIEYYYEAIPKGIAQDIKYAVVELNQLIDNLESGEN